VRRRRLDDRPIAGTRLIREWDGVEHCVTVRHQDYEYEGRPYKSLSSVAGAITGTRWNGWTFFGLRKQRRRAVTRRRAGGVPEKPGGRARIVLKRRCALRRFDPLWDELFPAEQARIVQLLVDRVDVEPDGLKIRVKSEGLAQLYADLARASETRRAE
jgi:hypothetical protein